MVPRYFTARRHTQEGNWAPVPQPQKGLNSHFLGMLYQSTGYTSKSTRHCSY